MMQLLISHDIHTYIRAYTYSHTPYCCYRLHSHVHLYLAVRLVALQFKVLILESIDLIHLALNHQPGEWPGASLQLSVTRAKEEKHQLCFWLASKDCYVGHT